MFQVVGSFRDKNIVSPGALPHNLLPDVRLLARGSARGTWSRARESQWSQVIFASDLNASFFRFGDTSLQEKINGDNYSILNFYFEQFKDKLPDAAAPRKDGDPSLEQLMKSLKSNIDSRRGKNVDILLISEEVKFKHLR